MDRISLAGLLVGLLAIIGGQLLEGGHLGSLTQPAALVIVVGGTLGAVMLQSTTSTFMRGLRMAKWVWLPPVVDQQRLINQITGWSHVSRREGLLALDAVVEQLTDNFTRKGLQLLVDGAEPERLREVLEVEINTFEQEMKLAARIWEAAGGYSPTIGILGAVLGLSRRGHDLADPALRQDSLFRVSQSLRPAIRRQAPRHAASARSHRRVSDAQHQPMDRRQRRAQHDRARHERRDAPVADERRADGGQRRRQ
ncbi:MAG TPA: flagellar motor protein, partial [Accumulibacter sp.]|nr:flagellar motor protein [Accumulibacter sp.]